MKLGRFPMSSPEIAPLQNLPTSNLLALPQLHFCRKWVKTHWPNYVQGKAEVGITADPADWRVARTIFVADDDKVATDYGREAANSPYRFYF